MVECSRCEHQGESATLSCSRAGHARAGVRYVAMVSINCLQAVIKSGGQDYPVLIGFLPAADILAVAEAPSFERTTPHNDIAHNVLTPPIKHWQRPIDHHRVQEIGLLFDDKGQFMPNPVLVSENVTAPGSIAISQQVGVGNVPTGTWTVQIQTPPTDQPKPLWILDGQHRINGLAGSNQSHNPVPLVLLANHGVAAYSGPNLANIFAQVTTSATPLDSLHDEWLTFAFDLKAYAPPQPRSQEHHDAMEAVARLCEMPVLPGGQANPFFSQVQFNHHRSVAPGGGGFQYTCIELKELVRKHYFSAPATQPRLAPQDVAAQIGLAYVGLQQSVAGAHAETVFFGDADHAQGIMQDAFLVGVFSHLLVHPPPATWKPLLASLSFPTTAWNFRSWVKSLTAGANALSRRIASEVMKDCFVKQSLPSGKSGPSDIAEFLRGNDLELKIEFSELTPKGRPAKAGRIDVDLTTGAKRARSINPRVHLKLGGKTMNVGRLTAIDRQSPPGRLVTYPIARGLVLNSTDHANPLQLIFRIELYGGNEEQAELDVTW